MKKRIGLIIVLGAVAGVGVLEALTEPAFTVRRSEYAIVTRFGRPVRVLDKAGLHWKWPAPIENVLRFDSRISVFETQLIQRLLGDKNPILAQCFVAWRIKDPLLYRQSLFARENAEQKLSDLVNSQMSNVLGDYLLQNVISTSPGEVKLDEIENRIRVGANLKTQEKYGITVVDVGFKRLVYPEAVAMAVYDRMASEREKEANKHRAEGTLEAAKIRAQTNTEESRILSAAFREAEIIKGDGDSRAMKIYADAYGRDPEFYRFLKSLEVYKTILAEKTTLVLSTESELLKYLNYRGPAALDPGKEPEEPKAPGDEEKGE